MSQQTFQGLLPRVKFRPRLALGGIFSGAILGLGLLILGQQFGRVYLGRTNLVLFIAGGAVASLVLANVGRVISISRMNGIISKAEDQLTVRSAQKGGTAQVTSEQTQPGASPGPPSAPAPATPAFAATHTVAAAVLNAYPEPDPSLEPETQLQAGLPLKVTETRGDWASVLAENGWTGWVDARELEEAE